MCCKKDIFRLKQIFRPFARQFTVDLIGTVKKSSDEIAALNWQRRIALLTAATKTEFYRRRFKKIGLSVGDVRDEKDWEKIPILTRRDIQDNMQQMVEDGMSRRRLIITSTGGSTGEPLRIYRPKGFPYEAFAVRMLGWWGVNVWDNSCYIFRHGYRGIGKVVNDLKWWPTRRAFLSAGNMNEEQCTVFYRQICNIHPKLLCGYVGAVSAFAEFLSTNRLVAPKSLKAIWTTAAPLPDPLRKNMQDIFDAPVYSQYGCCECGHLAAECTCQNGMHINSDWRHVEFVDEKGRNMPAGENGDVLITDMYAMEVPLIRYALGDRGRLMEEKCACGVNLPLMAPVKGRVSEEFPMPDGSRISGDYLTTIFDRYPDSIRGFRIHQSKDYSIRIEYLPREKTTADNAIQDAQQNLEKVTKNLVRLEFVAVERIPHDRGKTRYVTTDVET